MSTVKGTIFFIRDEPRLLSRVNDPPSRHAYVRHVNGFGGMHYVRVKCEYALANCQLGPVQLPSPYSGAWAAEDVLDKLVERVDYDVVSP